MMESLNFIDMSFDTIGKTLVKGELYLRENLVKTKKLFEYKQKIFTYFLVRPHELFEKGVITQDLQQTSKKRSFFRFNEGMPNREGSKKF